jgi:hypothetical protein
MDGLIELVCGALSIHEDVAKESGKMLFFPKTELIPVTSK